MLSSSEEQQQQQQQRRRRSSSVEYPQMNHLQEQRAPQRQRRVAQASTTETNNVIVFVSRYARGAAGDGNSSSSSNQMEVENNTIIPQPLPGDSRNEHHEFRQGFKRQVIDLLREFRQHFPYRQTIEWTIEYGRNDNEYEHTLHIFIKPTRSALTHH